MKRYLVATAVVAILFILPAGSWYYLQNGFDYRKAALETLKPKNNIKEAQIVTSNNDTLLTSQVFKNKTSVVYYDRQENVKSEDLEAILKQYENAYTFQFVHIVPKAETSRITKKEDLILLQENDAQSLINELQNHTFCLIDTGMRVRQRYLSERKDLTKLVEHVAIVLPRIPEKDIKLKRELK